MKQTLYVLEVITFTLKRRRHKDDYPPFATERAYAAYFARFEEAEDAIRQYPDHHATDDIYCFYIRQVPFGHFCRTHENADSYAAWLYDPTGKLIDERPYPTYDFGCHFHGRPADRLRFLPGDLVEYRGELCIVISVPRARYDLPLDDSDDSYCVMYLEQDFSSREVYHNHAECINVMPPRFPISPQLHEQIARVKAWYADCQRTTTP